MAESKGIWCPIYLTILSIAISGSTKPLQPNFGLIGSMIETIFIWDKKY